ncbi:MAG: class I SAM-dependent methyltransferase [Candidatus Rifleibacteriota bacterium]
MTQTLSYYEKHAVELCARYESARLDSFYEALFNYFFPGARLLEVGCGSGRDAAKAMSQGYLIEAVDGSQNLLEEAVRLHPELQSHLHFLRLPAPLPFKDHQFDGFYSVACLMHFADEEIAEILTELHRVLVPGGRGLVSVPARRDDVSHEGIDEHGRIFNVMPAELWVEMFRKQGFAARPGREEPDGAGRDGISWISYFLEKI